MPNANQTSDVDVKADQLARLAAMLGLEIAPDDLTALSNQLLLIDALEAAELHEFPPILKMDAGWHD